MKYPYDILFIGILLLSTAVMDTVLIIANPGYALKLFGSTLSGLPGWLVKIQSPVLHGLIGYGFARLRRWSFNLYMAYAAFGLANAFVNFYLLGYGKFRILFISTLIIITLYIFFRRKAFI